MEHPQKTLMIRAIPWDLYFRKPPLFEFRSSPGKHEWHLNWAPHDLYSKPSIRAANSGAVLLRKYQWNCVDLVNSPAWTVEQSTLQMTYPSTPRVFRMWGPWPHGRSYHMTRCSNGIGCCCCTMAMRSYASSGGNDPWRKGHMTYVRPAGFCNVAGKFPVFRGSYR